MTIHSLLLPDFNFSEEDKFYIENDLDTHEASDIYALSNEANAEVIDSELAKRFFGKAKSGVHLGVSGFYNYDIAVLTNPSALALFDVNLSVAKFHEITKEAVMQAENEDEFLEIFEKKINKATFKIRESDLEKIREKKVLWLKNSTNFNKIKQLFLENRVLISSLSLSNPRAPEIINDLLTEKGFTLEDIKTVYTSNIADWIMEDTTELYQFDKIIRIISNNALTIYSEGTLSQKPLGDIDYHPIVRKLSPSPTYVTKERLIYGPLASKRAQIKLQALTPSLFRMIARKALPVLRKVAMAI